MSPFLAAFPQKTNPDFLKNFASLFRLAFFVPKFHVLRLRFYNQIYAYQKINQGISP